MTSVCKWLCLLLHAGCLVCLCSVCFVFFCLSLLWQLLGGCPIFSPPHTPGSDLIKGSTKETANHLDSAGAFEVLWIIPGSSALETLSVCPCYLELSHLGQATLSSQLHSVPEPPGFPLPSSASPLHCTFHLLHNELFNSLLSLMFNLLLGSLQKLDMNIKSQIPKAYHVKRKLGWWR